MSERYTTERVQGLDGVEMAVDVFAPQGDASRPGFILVHGLASNARMWDGVAIALSSGGRYAAAVDLRGHGRSHKPSTGYDYDTLCGDLLSVIAHLAERPGLERPVAVGQSFGANLVLELAARRPRSLAGVGCVDGGTIGFRRRFEDFEAAWDVLAPPRLAGTPYAELEQRIRAMHPDWPETGHAGSMANFERLPDGTAAPWLSRDNHKQILHTMFDADPELIYPKIDIPVLLMPAVSASTPPQWESDKKEGVEIALRELPDGRVHWFSPADHDVHAQHPGEVAAVLLETFS